MDMIIVGRRGQITLPSRLRKRIGIQEGDRLAFLLNGDEVILRPLTKSLLDLRGSVQVTSPQEFNSIRRKVIENRGKKVSRDAS